MLTSLMLLIQRETHACVFDNNITHCDTGRARLADYLQGLQLAANALHALWPFGSGFADHSSCIDEES